MRTRTIWPEMACRSIEGGFAIRNEERTLDVFSKCKKVLRYFCPQKFKCRARKPSSTWEKCTNSHSPDDMFMRVSSVSLTTKMNEKKQVNGLIETEHLINQRMIFDFMFIHYSRY
jgi:hypothetical protein